jgi:hypothetical protein
MQEDPTQTQPPAYDHPDHTVFRINTTNAICTEIVLLPWVLDSQTVGCCTTNGLLYHTGGDGAYTDNPLSLVHDQDGVDVAGGAYQDNQYMGTVNLLTLEMKGVYNANPCPNPDSSLPCFGLPAPIPSWALPQYRRDSTQTDPTNNIDGPNEPSGIRGIAWSTELNAWYVSDGSVFKMSPDGLTCTRLTEPAFAIPTDDLENHPSGYVTNSGELKALAFIRTGGQTKLFGTYRMDHSTSGNTNGWIMQIDPVTGENIGQIAINYPEGGGSPIDEFGGLLGLAQNPQTGVIYGVRKTEDFLPANWSPLILRRVIRSSWEYSTILPGPSAGT